MLILQRHPGESIMIGDNIEIKVMGYNETTGVRLGIEAPKEITINRMEIHERIQQQEAKDADLKLLKKQAD